MLKLSNKKEHYCWCCDYNSNTGEGNLSRIFVNNLKIQEKIKIFTIKKIIVNKFFYTIFNYKYISPFIGILFCWISYLKKKTPVYVNYLPLWNIFLFILLPPKTIFGPITGGAHYNINKINLTRKYVFPILFLISDFFLKRRNIKVIFSTDLLKPYLSKLIKQKSYFNYVFKLISLKKKKKKEIDFLIYYREHKNKKDFFQYKAIENLLKLNFSVHIIGDRLKYDSVINHGFISNKKVQVLLKKTRFSLISNENVYSLFSIECINNHVKLITSINNKKEIKYFKKNFIFLNLNKVSVIKKLKKLISSDNPIFNN